MAATRISRWTPTGRGCHHRAFDAARSVVSPMVQLASSGLTRIARDRRDHRGDADVIEGAVSGCGWEPLAAAQDRGRAWREVFFDLGVVVGHDPLDVGVGFGGVAEGVAGGDEVE